jgi:hypothetical protein
MCRKTGIYSNGLDCVVGQEGIVQKGKAFPGGCLEVFYKERTTPVHVSEQAEWHGSWVMLFQQGQDL